MGSVSLNAYTAVIDATAGCKPGDAGAPPALASVAGVPLLTRTLEACQAAGIRKVLVTIAGSSLDEARRLGRRLAPRLLVEVIPAAPSEPWLAVRNGLNRAALIVPGDILVEAALLARLQSGLLPDDGAVLAVERGEAGLCGVPADAPQGAGAETGGVLVRGDRVIGVGLQAAASNGRATGVWIGSASLLDEVAAARLDGQPAPLDAVLRAATASHRLGWVSTGPEPAPVRVTALGAQATEDRLLAGLAEGDGGNGPAERLARSALRRVVLPLGLSPLTTAIVASGLVLAGALLVVLGGWTPLLAWPGAVLVLAGVLAARAERRLSAMHGRKGIGGPWGEALRDDALGLVFYASLGLHLSIAATTGDDVSTSGGLSRVSNVFLVLSVLFVVLVAYSRYVVYFDTVRRLGGVAARNRFTWWFEEGEAAPPSWWRSLFRRLRRARWSTVVALGAIAVLAGLTQAAFLTAVAGAVVLFALALLHQIQRGDL